MVIKSGKKMTRKARLGQVIGVVLMWKELERGKHWRCMDPEAE